MSLHPLQDRSVILHQKMLGLFSTILIVAATVAAFPEFRVAAWLVDDAIDNGNTVMLPVIMAPGAQGLSGKVLKQGVPLAGKRVEIVQNPGTPNESFAAVVETDAQGVWQAAVDTTEEYEIRAFGDMQANEFQEWVWYSTPTGIGSIEMPDIDVYYDGIIAPLDGATEKLGDGESVDFAWSSHPQATDYRVYLRDWPQVVWRSSPTSELQTQLDSSYIPSGDYLWHVGMNLDSGWWAWSNQHSLTIDSVAPGTTLSGKVLKQGVPLAGKRVEIVQNPGTPNESFAAVVETDAQGIWQAAVDTAEEYEIRGYGDMQANEFQEWVWYPTPASGVDVVMPEVDVYYGGLVAPEDGAIVDLGAGKSVTFEWTARSGAEFYRVYLRDYGNWGNVEWSSQATMSTSVVYDGDPPNGQYMWHTGMRLDSGWWCWSEHRELNVE